MDQQWEYRHFTSTADPAEGDRLLTERGAEGWEVVNFVVVEGVERSEHRQTFVYLLRRAAQTR